MSVDVVWVLIAFLWGAFAGAWYAVWMQRRHAARMLIARVEVEGGYLVTSSVITADESDLIKVIWQQRRAIAEAETAVDVAAAFGVPAPMVDEP